MSWRAGIVGALLVLCVVPGCGDDAADVPRSPATPVAESTAAPVASTPKTQLPKKQPASRSRPKASPTLSAATYVSCDANISVKAATTTCPFAQNVFFGYWNAGGGDFRAYSPASKQVYTMACREGGTIVCKTSDGGEVRFSTRAVALYDQSQADAYASSHDLGPMADSDDRSEDDYDAEYDFDTGYDEPHDDGYYEGGDNEGDNDGDGVTEPGEDIPYYDEGRGSRVRCADGTYSQSGGIQGACSHHGGVG